MAVPAHVAVGESRQAAEFLAVRANQRVHSGSTSRKGRVSNPADTEDDWCMQPLGTQSFEATTPDPDLSNVVRGKKFTTTQMRHTNSSGISFGHGGRNDEWNGGDNEDRKSGERATN